MSRLMRKLENLGLISGKLSHSVQNLIIYIRSNQEVKVNMDVFAGNLNNYLLSLAISHDHF